MFSFDNSHSGDKGLVLSRKENLFTLNESYLGDIDLVCSRQKASFHLKHGLFWRIETYTLSPSCNWWRLADWCALPLLVMIGCHSITYHKRCPPRPHPFCPTMNKVSRFCRSGPTCYGQCLELLTHKFVSFTRARGRCDSPRQQRK